MMRLVLTESLPRDASRLRHVPVLPRHVHFYRQLPFDSSARRRCTNCCSSTSGRDLALSVTCSFDKLQNPARNNIRYSSALEEFVSAAVLAYECGCSHEMLVEELSRDRKGTIQGEGVEHYEGLTEVGLVFLVMKTNTKGKRWSTAAAGTAAVSQEFEKRWLGFVKLISNAYFLKRMAWFPLDRLKLEQMASCGKVDPTEIVAERARIVFTALQMIAPQFPKA